MLIFQASLCPMQYQSNRFLLNIAASSISHMEIKFDPSCIPTLLTLGNNYTFCKAKSRVISNEKNIKIILYKFDTDFPLNHIISNSCIFPL